MKKYRDLTGQRFGRLIAIELAENPKEQKRTGKSWLCLCDCGNKKIIRSNSLLMGGSKSCGCLSKESRDNIHYIDLTDQKFNRLHVIERILNPKNIGDKHLWRCLCDCGNETFLSENVIKSGAIKSCGCLSIEKATERIKKIAIDSNKGIKTVENSCLLVYKQNAKLRNLKFELSDNDTIDIFHQPCFYCGIIDKKQNRYTKEFFYLNGIDRLNNLDGYIYGNVVSCCRICNHAKFMMGIDEFYIWIERVYNYSLINSRKEDEIMSIVNNLFDWRNYALNNS